MPKTHPGAIPGAYHYETNCISSDYNSIRRMLEREEEVSRQTFAKALGLNEWKWIQRELGYDRDFPISRDWHVYYAKSWYRGTPCYFLRWSGIEYVFTLQE